MEKRGLFSIDASFAAIIVISISILFFVILNAFSTSLSVLDSRQKTAALIVFSNEIVRKEGVYKTNTETISNLIVISELSSFLSNLKPSIVESYGFNLIEVRLYGRNEEVFVFNKRFSQPGSQEYCITRFVFIKDLNEEGILKVCAR
ncbi:MAG: hypothetical protein NZ903_02555 [Candidatus Micrarchaeota archaeon]|nr:hypothetical protein [Candidatus Micrarchaeota archaeon]